MKKLLIVIIGIFSVSFLSLLPLTGEASSQRSYVHVQLVDNTDELPAAGDGNSSGTGKTTLPQNGSAAASESNKKLPQTNEVIGYLAALMGTLLLLGVVIILLARRKANER
ncbi:LPXTG cell wall anchor domain-containing protein [Enterococcus sp. 669A]|uniref:LPXTG cell wall anchor domain-containing protein n=1 Tax=Candidatus Enterococcus moelleringii TaxID=2815325 RepID=A0ABS3L9W8_9ENTE|nr:LPXTG cell wall anchor domain-containing protein [Enterococcus sp. 669A]MBO1306427.1 LPXTG cell wall anchor domain-containing protein [Enterococcus sp. 669A]